MTIVAFPSQIGMGNDFKRGLRKNNPVGSAGVLIAEHMINVTEQVIQRQCRTQFNTSFRRPEPSLS